MDEVLRRSEFPEESYLKQNLAETRVPPLLGFPPFYSTPSRQSFPPKWKLAPFNKLVAASNLQGFFLLIELHRKRGFFKNRQRLGPIPIVVSSAKIGEGQKGTAGRGRDRKCHDNFRHFSDNFRHFYTTFPMLVHVT